MRRMARPRSEHAHRAAIDATLRLLLDAGVEGVTLEEVAARSGEVVRDDGDTPSGERRGNEWPTEQGERMSTADDQPVSPWKPRGASDPIQDHVGSTAVGDSGGRKSSTLVKLGVTAAVVGAGVWIVAAIAERHPGLSVLQIDAHADLRDTYMGTPHNHACAMRRVLEHAPATQVGIRSLSTEEAAAIPSLPTHVFYDFNMRADPNWMDRVVATLSDTVYVTIDVDGFDPAIMPATGTPEPGGLSARELLDAVRRICLELPVVGIDVVEVSPPYDHADITAALANRVVLEALSPFERAVFVLREAFDMPFAEIAAATGKSEAACRQLAARARRHVDGRRPRFEARWRRRDGERSANWSGPASPRRSRPAPAGCSMQRRRSAGFEPGSTTKVRRRSSSRQWRIQARRGRIRFRSSMSAPPCPSSATIATLWCWMPGC